MVEERCLAVANIKKRHFGYARRRIRDSALKTEKEGTKRVDWIEISHYKLMCNM